MDAVRPRERLISILNDNDSPSFAVRPRHSSPSDLYHSKQERPALHRLEHFYPRDLNTPTPSTPPLSRLNSTSSKASSSTMDSPSPQTPVYHYDPQLITPYDPVLRQDVTGFLPSSSAITPLMDTMMIVAPTQDQMLPFQNKSLNNAMPLNYPGLPISPTDGQHVPHQSSSSSKSNTQLPASNPTANPPTKKNKYPCPYAASHQCTATFTTSGHAARHGKKHTGEKGVHCPVCNKAFTRKDNMKQHERTHKGSASGSNSDDTNHKRSKAAITKEAARAKKASSEASQATSNAGLIHSPLSEVASIDPSVTGTPAFHEDHSHYNDTSMTTTADPSSPNVSAYPPLGDEPAFGTLAQLDRSAGTSLSNAQAPMQRTFSDLDTLALAAAYDPYSQANVR